MWFRNGKAIRWLIMKRVVHPKTGYRWEEWDYFKTLREAARALEENYNYDHFALVRLDHTYIKGHTRC